MSYLFEYDRIPPHDAAAQVGLVTKWLRTEWRAFFSELRERRPVFQIPGITLLTRYDDVTEVLTRHKDFSVRIYGEKMDAVVGPFMLGRDESPLNWKDKSLMRAVVPLDDLGRVRTLVGELARQSLDANKSDTLEVVGSLGRRVPVQLCDNYFGFPGPDEATMLRWSKATQWDFFKNLGNDSEIHGNAVAAGSEMKEYLKEFVIERRECGAYKDNVVDRLLQLNLPANLGFSDERLIANISGLLIGAVETTSQAIVQALDQILRRSRLLPSAIEAARAGGDQVDEIVWEALRFNPINPLLFRVVETDALIAAGTTRETVLSKGGIVFACTASAMHDETAIVNASKFVSGRPAHDYIHFGYGHHVCLGQHVGGVMIPEVIRQILLRPGIGLLPGNGTTIDFGGGPFPEQYTVAIATD